MSALTQEHDNFQAVLASHFQPVPNDPLGKIRQKAWTRLQDKGLPTRNTENYRYLKLRQLYANSYSIAEQPIFSHSKIAPFLLEECENSYLVFVNGTFQPEASNLSGISERAVVTTLNKATTTYGSFLLHRWNTALADENDPFVLANAALHTEGAFIYLPPRTIVKAPLQILHIIDTDKDPMLFPRLHLFAGVGSQIDLIFTPVVISGNGFLLNQVVDITLDDDAHVRCFQKNCQYADDVWIFDALRATLKRNSTLKTISATDGAASIRHDYHTVLQGENSEVQLNAIWALSEHREAHNHVLIDHQAPNCRSMQLFKGALKDFSKSSFEGKILVRQAAQKTDAFQLNNNLLLSEGTHADTKPNLEIFADDVKASHGATVGQLDADQLFYMLARGVKKTDAERLLVQGYFHDVLDIIPYPSLQEEIGQICLKAIS